MSAKPNLSPDHSILYRIAERQAGYFTTAQADTANFARPLLTYHVRTGQFLRVKHGVYRLARFPEMPHADLVIAFLEVGPQAVLSHESALTLYDLTDALPGSIHLTVPRTTSRRHPGLRLHTSHIAPEEITQRAGLPVTTVRRTIADLIAGHRSAELVSQTIDEALRRGLVSRQALVDVSAQRGGRIKAILEEQLTP